MSLHKTISPVVCSLNMQMVNVKNRCSSGSNCIGATKDRPCYTTSQSVSSRSTVVSWCTASSVSRTVSRHRQFNFHSTYTSAKQTFSHYTTTSVVHIVCEPVTKVSYSLCLYWCLPSFLLTCAVVVR